MMIMMIMADANGRSQLHLHSQKFEPKKESGIFSVNAE